MISPAEIKIKSGKKYSAYLQSIVEGAPFAEITIIGDKRPSKDYAKYELEITDLVSQSKEKKGYGYTIEFQTIRKKEIGTQDLPVKFSFETESDFLRYLHKEKEVAEFRENCSSILSIYPELKEWLYKFPDKVIENKNKWNDILKVCCYFKQNPIPNKYIRELPINVHTKFIEENKGILRELLDILIEEYIQQTEKDFERRFNLKCEEPLIRFRILDKQMSQKYFSEIDDLSIPISQFEQLDLPLRNVFVVENKINLLTIALTLPEIREAIVIFGSGYKVENLKNVEWLKRVNLFYWGDLDVHGFEILSQFRGYFPNAKSFLMDKDTFHKFFEKDSGTPSKATVKNLSDDEKQLYESLKNNNWRLEQEKIPLEYVKEYIERMLFNSSALLSI